MITKMQILYFSARRLTAPSLFVRVRAAPSAIRRDSIGIETYSPYQDKDLEDAAVFDGGDLELPFGNTRAALDMIEDFAAKVISDGKIPFMVGGEHLVTLSSVKAAAKKYPDLHIIHFDAHTDLRDDYMGEKLSHATVMRRCWEIVGDGRIFQFGIRSGEREEFLWGARHVYTNKFNLNGLYEIVQKLKNKPVYLTIDLESRPSISAARKAERARSSELWDGYVSELILQAELTSVPYRQRGSTGCRAFGNYLLINNLVK